MRRGAPRALGTVIGAVILAVLILAVLGFIYYLVSSTAEFYQQLAMVLEKKTSAPLIASGVDGWWRQVGDTLEIHLENGNPTAVLVTTVTILWSDGSSTVYDHYNATPPAFTATVTAPDGTSTAENRLPLTLGVAYTVDMEIETGGKTADKVYVTLSASPVVAVLPLKNYNQLYPNATVVAGNLSLAASPYPGIAHELLDWTKTWRGTVTGYTVADLNGSVERYSVNTGIQVSGDTASLNATDGNYLVVDAQQAITLQDFQVTADNLIYATDFDAGDPFAAGNWSYTGGSWSWGSSIGYNGTGGVQQTDSAASGGIADGYEVIAYPVGNNASTTRAYYVMAHVFAETGYDDIVLYDNTGSYVYTYSIDLRDGYFDLWLYNSRRWNSLNYTTPSPSANTWYTSLAYYDPAGRLVATFIDGSGNTYVVTADDNTFIPASYAIGTYGGTAVFDDFIVSYGNPRYLNITVTLDGAPVQGWTVEVVADNGWRVSATTGSDGTAVLDVTWHPIIRGARVRIYNSLGGLVADFYASDFIAGGTLYGGNRYTAALATSYVADTASYATVDTAGLLEAGAWYVFTANVSGSYRLLVYNWTSNAWRQVASGTLAAGQVLSYRVLYPASSGVVNSGNSTVAARIVFTASTPARVSVDMLNAAYRKSIESTFTALLVARGGGSSVDVYLDNGTGLQYLYSIDASTVFNGSATIAYDMRDNLLLLVNQTGVYAARLEPGAVFTPVTAACTALAGVEAEAVNTTSNAYLVVLRGGGGDTYCIVDLSTNSTTTGSLSQSLGENVAVDTAHLYPASASTPDASTAYFLVYSSDRARPEIVSIDASSISSGSPGFSHAADPPGGYSAGLAAGPDGTLWLALARGGVYHSNSTGGFQRLNAVLGFTPWGPGDRLEYYNATALLFVRADGTTEAYLVRTG